MERPILDTAVHQSVSVMLEELGDVSGVIEKNVVGIASLIFGVFSLQFCIVFGYGTVIVNLFFEVFEVSDLR